MNITIEVLTPDTEILASALRTEIESAPYTKSKMSLKVKDTLLTLKIEADDISALRGTFNSCMNWLIAALESLSV